jgi:hypothetical protein
MGVSEKTFGNSDLDIPTLKTKKGDKTYTVLM